MQSANKYLLYNLNIFFFFFNTVDFKWKFTVKLFFVLCCCFVLLWLLFETVFWNLLWTICENFHNLFQQKIRLFVMPYCAKRTPIRQFVIILFMNFRNTIWCKKYPVYEGYFVGGFSTVKWSLLSPRKYVGATRNPSFLYQIYTKNILNIIHPRELCHAKRDEWR